MITNNLISLMSGIFSATVGFTLKNLQGSEQSWSNRSYYEMFTNDLPYKDYNADEAGCYLLLGSGDTTPTSVDYKLDSVQSDYSVLTQNHVVYTNVYTNQLFIITRIIQNTSDNPLTIKELGLCGWKILFARDVLPEPVILQPGEKHTFTMTISLE